MKTVAASATFSKLARSLFVNKETAREMTQQILSGAEVMRVAGHTFRRVRVAVMTGDK